MSPTLDTTVRAMDTLVHGLNDHDIWTAPPRFRDWDVFSACMAESGWISAGVQPVSIGTHASLE